MDIINPESKGLLIQFYLKKLKILKSIVGDNNENYNYNDCSIKLVEFKMKKWSDNNKVDTFPISIKNLIVERAVYENLCFYIM